MARPLAVLFDAYGTLLDVHSAVGRHADRLGPEAAAISALWRNRQLEYSWIMSATGAYEDFWALTEHALDHAMAVHGLADRVLRADLLAAYRKLDAYPGIAAVLQALRARGLGTAILSNGAAGMLADAVAASGLDEYLDAVLSVDPLRRYKPDPRVYQLGCDRFGGRPGEIAFVSSNPWDAYGAMRFGFRVFWLNRAGARPEYGLAEHATVISDLATLPDLIG
jgi:2-haloacid dehalogenase